MYQNPLHKHSLGIPLSNIINIILTIKQTILDFSKIPNYCRLINPPNGTPTFPLIVILSFTFDEIVATNLPSVSYSSVCKYN
jgi:hypothetical protein